MIKGTKAKAYNLVEGLQPQKDAKLKAPNGVKRISTAKMRQVNSARIPGQNSQKDPTVESSHGYGRSTQGLTCSPSCKNVWATTGIHPSLQIKVNMVPSLVFILHFHRCGSMGKKVKGG